MRRSRTGRPAQFAAVFSENDEYAQPPRGGVGRVVAVVVVAHVIFIGGFAAFKRIGNEGEAAAPTVAASTKAEPAPAASSVKEAEEALAPLSPDEKRIIVDHPSMPGFSRYRVSANEELAAVARQFNASVAELERLNDLKSGKPLRVGQWLTVPGSSEQGAKAAVNQSDAVASTGPVRAEELTKEPTTSQTVRASVITGENKPSTPAPAKVEVVTTASTSSPKPQSATSAPQPGKSERTYTVLSGDTAYRIAKKYGMEWQELLSYNGIKDPLDLKAGQVLRIP